jgi:hypothetical protein
MSFVLVNHRRPAVCRLIQSCQVSLDHDKGYDEPAKRDTGDDGNGYGIAYDPEEEGLRSCSC